MKPILQYIGILSLLLFSATYLSQPKVDIDRFNEGDIVTLSSTKISVNEIINRNKNEEFSFDNVKSLKLTETRIFDNNFTYINKDTVTTLSKEPISDNVKEFYKGVQSPKIDLENDKSYDITNNAIIYAPFECRRLYSELKEKKSVISESGINVMNFDNYEIFGWDEEGEFMFIVTNLDKVNQNSYYRQLTPICKVGEGSKIIYLLKDKESGYMKPTTEEVWFGSR